MPQPTPRPLMVQRIPIDQIQPSPHQARKYFDEESIRGLAESIRQEGLIQPVSVRVGDGAKGRMGEESVVSPVRPSADSPIHTYELISGERRLRAAKLLGWTEIDACVIEVVSEGEAAAKGLIENLQREDLNPIEEAEGFKELLDLKDSHWTQKQIASACGKQQSRISESLKLLELPDVIKENIRQRKLSREHGVELLRLFNANSQKSMANKIIKGGWSVKHTRAAIDAKLDKSKSHPASLHEPDPLAMTWQDVNLMGNPLFSGSAFKAHYHGGCRWSFEMVARPMDPKADLARYFYALAETLDGSAMKGEPQPHQELKEKLQGKMEAEAKSVVDIFTQAFGGPKAFKKKMAKEEAISAAEEEAMLRKIEKDSRGEM